MNKLINKIKESVIFGLGTATKIKNEQIKDDDLFKEILKITPKQDILQVYLLFLWYRLQQDKYRTLWHSLNKANLNLNIDGKSISESIVGDQISELKELLQITNPKLKDEEMEQLVIKIAGLIKSKK